MGVRLNLRSASDTGAKPTKETPAGLTTSAINRRSCTCPYSRSRPRNPSAVGSWLPRVLLRRCSSAKRSRSASGDLGAVLPLRNTLSPTHSTRPKIRPSHLLQLPSELRDGRTLARSSPPTFGFMNFTSDPDERAAAVAVAAWKSLSWLS